MSPVTLGRFYKDVLSFRFISRTLLGRGISCKVRPFHPSIVEMSRKLNENSKSSHNIKL